ncbi:hypothetical protein Hanom_Chr00s000005g01611591 [Helianthus anomalus]
MRVSNVSHKLKSNKIHYKYNGSTSDCNTGTDLYWLTRIKNQEKRTNTHLLEDFVFFNCYKKAKLNF